MNQVSTFFRGKQLIAGIAIGLFISCILAWLASRVIDHVVLYDELLHLLSARGLMATGEPVILDGVYKRAELFTRFVSWSFQSAGASPVTARIPSLIFAIMLTIQLAVWSTLRLGKVGGVAAAAVLCLLPTTIELAVFARFYTLHALLILSLGIAAYEASLPGRSVQVRVWLALFAIALLPVGLHLQETTLIAFVAMIAGVGAVILLDRWSEIGPIVRRYPLRIAVACIGLIVVAVAAAQLLGFAQRLQEAPLWAMHSAHRPHYYLFAFTEKMPLLWPLFPAAAVMAFYFNRRVTLFCLTVFVVAFLVHSVAAQKSLRYIYYAMPFYCVVWGCAVGGTVESLVNRWSKRLLPRAFANGMAWLLTLAVLLVSAEGQHLTKMASGRLKIVDALPYAVEADWIPAVPVLAPLASSATTIVTSNAMKAIYYLGKYDFELNASIVGETETEQEFGRDERTGRRAVGTVDSLRKILDMPGSQLVILEQETMNRDSGVSTLAVAEIERRCKPIDLPTTAELAAWLCGTR